MLKLILVARRAFCDIQGDVVGGVAKRVNKIALHVVFGMTDVVDNPGAVICGFGVDAKILETEKAHILFLCVVHVVLFLLLINSVIVRCGCIKSFSFSTMRRS